MAVDLLGWEITTPSGEVVFVKNLKAYCREHDLDDGSMNSVASGRFQRHRGYGCKRVRRASLPDPDPLFCAWLAGFVDGEGCFCIKLDKNRHFPLIVIANTDRAVLEHIVNTLGYGHIATHDRSQYANHKTGYAYQVNGMNAIALARIVQPYLQIKARQAELLMSFPLKDSYFVQRDIGLIREEIRQEIQRLNDSRRPNTRAVEFV